ncbi:MAG: hypothetical protein LBU58_10200, partial [Clostridiales bacterium]|nr:hypothetical protein [Clostridiales bacterium]
FDESETYSLYTVRADRSAAAGDQPLYVGADFIVDVSKTRIAADGFGYAANAYGAVRLVSLCDGFDRGVARHIYLVGQDVEIQFKGYEDADLSRETGLVAVEVEKRAVSARDYLLMFSDARALAAKSVGGTPPDYYDESLYRVYAEALDGLLAVHYFFSRSEIYARAEQPRLRSLVETIRVPAGASRIVSADLETHAPPRPRAPGSPETLLGRVRGRLFARFGYLEGPLTAAGLFTLTALAALAAAAATSAVRRLWHRHF